MNDRCMKILIVEDSVEDLLLLERFLRAAGYCSTPESVCTLEALRSALQRQWDLVISDFALPGFNGADVMELVERQTLPAPVIILTGVPARATGAVKRGTPVVDKGDWQSLTAALARLIPPAKTT